MRVGIACPYAWDVPGGVQAHVADLAVHLQRLGHEVGVLAPVADVGAPLPPFVTPAGRAVPVPYNGSVARLSFGPLALARTLRWLRAWSPDVLHVHEPTVPSVSMLACFAARGPLVATFHTSTERSRALQVFGGVLQPGLEKVVARIAVSAAARRVIVEHLGDDAVLVPNGVDVARFTGARPLEGLPPGPRVVFLGRTDEPRKGLAVLLAALPALRERVPGVRLLVAGPGELPPVPDGCADVVHVLGRVSEEDKPRVYASGDVYCAPNTHGESFGIVLAEAMAAGTPVVASDLEAFRAVLQEGRAGVLVPVGDSAALARALADLLQDPDRQAALSSAGAQRVRAYDWEVVARAVVEVYESAVLASPGAVALDEGLVSDLPLGPAQEPDDDPEDEREDELADPRGLRVALRRWTGR